MLAQKGEHCALVTDDLPVDRRQLTAVLMPGQRLGLILYPPPGTQCPPQKVVITAPGERGAEVESLVKAPQLESQLTTHCITATAAHAHRPGDEGSRPAVEAYPSIVGQPDAPFSSAESSVDFKEDLGRSLQGQGLDPAGADGHTGVADEG
jgi:hypothetical protein